MCSADMCSGGATERWNGYLTATVIVEVDGDDVDLTGPCASDDWPFPGAVWALTAWDPAGKACSRALNYSQNLILKERLEGLGARTWPSRGYAAPDDGGRVNFVDEGFVVTGVSEQAILDLAGAFGQEAVYRIDAFELSVVSVDGSVTRSRPRVNQ